MAAGLDGYKISTTEIIITIGLFVFFFPIKVLKIFIVYKYMQFAQGNISKGDLLIPVNVNATAVADEDVPL